MAIRRHCYKCPIYVHMLGLGRAFAVVGVIQGGLTRDELLASSCGDCFSVRSLNSAFLNSVPMDSS